MSLCLDKLCRTCMTEAHAMLPIYEKDRNDFMTSTSSSTILDMLQAFTALQIQSNDSLPQSICLACISDINSAYSFKQKCERSDATLRAYLDQITKQTPQIVKNETITPDLYEISRLFKSNQDIITKSNSDESDIYKEEVITYLHSDNSSADNQHDEENDEQNVDEINENEEEIENQTTILDLIRTEHEQPNSEVNVSENEIEECTFFIVFECGMCAEQFTSKNEQRNHMLDEHKAKSCPKCDEFFDFQIYDDHLASHLNDDEHIQNDLIIDEGLRLDIMDQLAEKIPNAESNNIEVPSSNNMSSTNYKCNKCNASFAKERSLRMHNNSNKCTEPSHECCICKKVFARKRNLVQHMLFHQEKKYKCLDCDKEFSRQDRYNLHTQEHKGIKKHQCSYCAKGFNILSALKDHVRTHNGEKPYLCSVCGKGFSQSTNLRQHIMRHNKTKPHHCFTCNTSFVSKGELEAHLRKHTGEHPFVCDVCGKGFTTSSSLVKHKRIHTGERPHPCDLCPMRFTALGTLKNHRRTHTGERPHACIHCDKKFVQKSDMMSHMKIHKDVQRTCTICRVKCPNANSFKEHMASHEAVHLHDLVEIEEQNSIETIENSEN